MNETRTVLLPIFKKYDLDEKFHQATLQYTIVQEAVTPILRPIWRPLEKATQRLLELHRQAAHTAFVNVQETFVSDICPYGKKWWKAFQKQHKEFSPQYQLLVTNALNEACHKPTEFLTNVGYSILLVIVFLLRWFLLRTLLAILLLPVRVLLYPWILLFRLVFGNRTKKELEPKIPPEVVPNVKADKKTN